MFSVTVYRNDTASENKGKIEFKVADRAGASLITAQLVGDAPKPFLWWSDVDEVEGILATSLIAKVEIKEDR